MALKQSAYRVATGIALLALYFGQSACGRRAMPQPNASTAPAASTPIQTPTAAAATESPSPSSTSENVAQPNSALAPGQAPTTSGSDRSTAQAPIPQAASSTIAEPPPPPRVYTLPAGSHVSVFTTAGLSTKTARPGDNFSATLAHSIVDHGWVIARQGAPVQGVVVNSNPGGRVKGVASLTVALRRLTLADGRRVELSTSGYTKKAPTTRKKDAAKIGIGAGVGALIGGLAGGRKGALIGLGAGGGAGTAYVLATRGDPAVIPGESHLTFRLSSPVRITQRVP